MMALMIRKRDSLSRLGNTYALLGSVAFILLNAGVVVGQIQSRDSDIAPESLFSDQLILLAMEALEGDGDPREDQLTRAGILLDLGLRYNPRDAEGWRLRAELAKRMGDSTSEVAALRRYCRLVPTDDAAQLAWVMGSVISGQTLDGRVAKAEKILDSTGGKRLSTALQSRLSTVVARGALEIGDTDKFVKRLKNAIRLDPANKEAARLMLDWLLSHGEPADRIGRALMHLVFTDPVDPVSRAELGDLLLAHGLYQPAAVQYQAAQALSGGQVNDRFVYNWVLCIAASGRVNEALNVLSDYETMLSYSLASQPPSDGDDGSGDGDETVERPEAHLAMDLELLRLVILGLSDQPLWAQGSFKRLDGLLRERIHNGDAQAEADLVWLGLLTGQAIPDAPTLETAKQLRLEDGAFAGRLIGWTRLREGETEAARRAFLGYEEIDPFAAYGLAQTFDVQDDLQRQALLQQVVEMAPGNLAGMIAANDLLTAGVGRQLSDETTKLVELLNSAAGKLALPDFQEDHWTSLAIKMSSSRYRFLEPIRVTITLQSLCDFPLAIGPGGPLSSQLLVFVSPRRAGFALGDLPPIVVDMRRRLVLEPHESLEVVVRLDRSQLGMMLSDSPAEAFGFDVKAVLDPRFGPNGNVMPGLLGGTAATRLIERTGSMISPQQIDQSITELGHSDPVRQMLRIAQLVKVATELVEVEEMQDTVNRIVKRVDRTYHQLTAMGQAWALRFLPPGEKGESLFGAIHESAKRSDDPAIRVVYAATQINDPQSVEITTMLRHTDPVIREFAQALRTGLEMQAEAEAEREMETAAATEQ